MIKTIVLMLMMGVGVLYSCGIPNNESGKKMESPPPVATYRKISPEEAKAMMDEEKKYVLLDVRTEEEFREYRIDGAILIPDYEIKDRASGVLPDKGAVILVYCRSGRRSAIAAKELLDMGYTGVYDFGGIIDWPYDTVKE